MSCKKILLIFAYLFFSICFSFIAVNQVKADQVSAPTILEANSQRNEDGLGNFYLKGLTEANTEVLIYIDGVYSDLAIVNSQGTATDSFYYEHKTSLSPAKHLVAVVARDKTSLVLSKLVEVEFVVPDLAAPTLVSPDESDIIGKAKPLITGLTISSTFVHVYIDGVHYGKTTIVKHQSGTANFAYRPFLNLNVGWHEVYAAAEDKYGIISGQSNVLKFRVEEPMPSPIIFTPIVNSQTTENHPFIVGLAKNDSLIKVYIDHKLDGRFLVNNNESGTASFAYKSFQSLTRGSHLVYTTAIDSRGKESAWSNVVYFTVREPVIGQSAEEQKSEPVVKIEEPKQQAEEPEIIISPDKGEIEEIKDTGKAEEKEQVTDKEITDLIKEDVSEEKKQTGLIDEDKSEQSKLKLNLIIFIAFLLGVIVWIFWVNKELIKEKRKKNKPLSTEPFSQISEEKEEDK
ncbi:MAG: hypothetical protein ABIG60_04070 [Patescibacteria group bacterium]